MPEPPERQVSSPNAGTVVAPRPLEESDSSVMLLVREARWPDVPGVCCWRSSIRAAFTAAGAKVDEVSWAAPEGWRPKRPSPPASRRQRLLGVGRAVQRRVQRAVRRLRGGAADQAGPPIANADLIVTETIDAALALAAHGVPRHRIWALALPTEHVLAGGRSEEALRYAHAASRIGGFVTDSADARAAIERATAGKSRSKVVIFPPLATDRPCPDCVGGPSHAGTAVDDLSAAQLALWRRIIGERSWGATQPDAQPAGAAWLPYSFPAARLLGPAGVAPPLADSDDAPAGLGEVKPAWEATAETPDAAWPPAGWTVDDQHRAARELLALATDEGLATPRAYPRRSVVISGFDLKFIGELAEHLDRRADLDVAVDDWPGLARHGHRTTSLVRAAQSVVAEWARPSAIWLAEHKRPGQFLVVRLHRYEITTQYPRDIPIGKVDAVVYISPLMGRRIRDELGWPAEKLVHIPNFLDVDWFDRPKPVESRFMLGLVGIVPRIKRMDLALDLLQAVRREDPRFRLIVRSAMPWSNPYIWPRPEERDYFGWCFERIERDPLLRGSVIFDPPGRDMARWFSGVGHILSTSDVEGGHTVVAEGMASGAVPVIRPWAGSSEVYETQWIHPSIDAAASYIVDHADADLWAQRSADARAEVRVTHDPRAVVAAWTDLLHGDLAAARQHFPQLDDGDG